MSTYKMTVQIKDVEKSSFSACCLRELKSEGVNEGDIISGTYNPINKALDFKSPKTGVDCTAWVGTTCKKVNQKYLIQSALYPSEWYLFEGKQLNSVNKKDYDITKLEIADINIINKKLQRMNLSTASRAFVINY